MHYTNVVSTSASTLHYLSTPAQQRDTILDDQATIIEENDVTYVVKIKTI